MLQIKNILIKALFYFSILGLIFILYCKKDDNPVSPNQKNNLQIQFTNDFIGEHGWVILHSLDGKSAIVAKRVSGDAFVDFGKMNADHVTITFVKESNNNILGITYYDVPVGNWIVKGAEYPQEIGTALIHMNFPIGEYKGFSCGIPNGGRSHYIYDPEFVQSISELDIPFTIKYLDDNDNLFAFGAVFDNNLGKSYCGWIMDQKFIKDQTNEYTINLDQEMEVIDINFSFPIRELQLDTYVGELYQLCQHSRRYYSEDQEEGRTSYSVHYASTFPAKRFRLWGRNYNIPEQGEHYFIYTYEKIPSNVEIFKGLLNVNIRTKSLAIF